MTTMTSTWDPERGRIHMIDGIELEEEEVAPPILMRVAPAIAPQRVAGRRPGVLYRYFDEDGTLLYVGITVDATAREGWHRTGSGWRTFAHTISRVSFDDIEDAEQMERWAITRESPIFNKVHNETLAAQDRVVAYLTRVGRSDLLPQLSILKMGTPDGRGRVEVRRDAPTRAPGQPSVVVNLDSRRRTADQLIDDAVRRWKKV